MRLNLLYLVSVLAFAVYATPISVRNDLEARARVIPDFMAVSEPIMEIHFEKTQPQKTLDGAKEMVQILMGEFRKHDLWREFPKLAVRNGNAPNPSPQTDYGDFDLTGFGPECSPKCVGTYSSTNSKVKAVILLSDKRTYYSFDLEHHTTVRTVHD
ncbi:hypothetical protein GYMLUDRAFT_39754 [Collybiopsis luxurians FD-317 M1]|nr:hypothetical protein GYMLUDRAFT_39754 [Collybiopsis luxurians FD-317 M1]